MAPELPLPPRNQTTEIIQSTASVFPVLSPVEPAAHQSPSLLIREIYQPLPSTVILPAPMPAVRQHEAEDAPRRPIPPPGVYEAPVRQPWHQSLDQPASDRGAIRPAERFAPPIPSSSPETAPAPVIHISIGRIEVHAAPQPAPAAGQRANRAEPVMALEEYLRRRNGGPA
jgi:hypothetical protein